MTRADQEREAKFALPRLYGKWHQMMPVGRRREFQLYLLLVGPHYDTRVLSDASLKAIVDLYAKNFRFTHNHKEQ